MAEYPTTSVLMDLEELINFLQATELEMGAGDASIFSIFVPYVEITKEPILQARWEAADRSLEVMIADRVLRLPITRTLEPERDAERFAGFGMRKVTSGVWTLAPSVNLPGVMHGFFTIYGVPEPAPWESRIILLS